MSDLKRELKARERDGRAAVKNTDAARKAWAESIEEAARRNIAALASSTAASGAKLQRIGLRRHPTIYVGAARGKGGPFAVARAIHLCLTNGKLYRDNSTDSTLRLGHNSWTTVGDQHQVARELARLLSAAGVSVEPDPVPAATPR